MPGSELLWQDMQPVCLKNAGLMGWRRVTAFSIASAGVRGLATAAGIAKAGASCLPPASGAG